MKETITTVLHASDPKSTRRFNSSDLIASYTVKDLFKAGELNLAYWEVDRTAIGGAIPTETSLKLGGSKFLATEFFCDRRELGVINLGGQGTVSVDGDDFALGPKDALYVGRGSREVSFSSADASSPAVFYLLSYPAHAEHPTMVVKAADIEPLELGTPEEANERSLYKMICPGVVESCQLVMGFTVLKPGSVWNTMPPHTHARRSEVYLYFDVPEDKAVMHFMGEPDETRHLVMRNLEAALSPNWSIHCGAGIGNYSFVWGMGGENQDFTDMDHLQVSNLR
ncbi:5-keto 4-deoxyuronate isomerase superfamily [Verrucomicrobiia bacterium DG1235]|nr:5-keto 4-deoxyuronate isomerase superfamily [Verrucomicrobiae bacterium DG1235]